MGIHPKLNLAMRLAREAGGLIHRALVRPDRIKIAEKNPHDYVTSLDQQIDRFLVDSLKKAYPMDGFITEEQDEMLSGSEGQHVWIIDPIDGTNNLIRGIPFIAISIALKIQGQVEHALIYDPLNDEMFTASLGQGCILDQVKSRVSPLTDFNKMVFDGGLNSTLVREAHPFQQAMLEALPSKVLCFRRLGSAALALAYVACGRLDAAWFHGLKPWDMAAGALLVKEAKGKVTTYDGDVFSLDQDQILVGSPFIVDQLLALSEKAPA